MFYGDLWEPDEKPEERYCPQSVANSFAHRPLLARLFQAPRWYASDADQRDHRWWPRQEHHLLVGHVCTLPHEATASLSVEGRAGMPSRTSGHGDLHGVAMHLGLDTEDLGANHGVLGEVLRHAATDHEEAGDAGGRILMSGQLAGSRPPRRCSRTAGGRRCAPSGASLGRSRRTSRRRPGRRSGSLLRRRSGSGCRASWRSRPRPATCPISWMNSRLE